MEGAVNNNFSFKNRFWQLRHERGLEQKQVARLLGYETCDQLSRYERGSRQPGFKNALKLALIYGISLDEMFAVQLQCYRKELQERIKLFTHSLKTASAEIQLADEHQTTNEVVNTINTAPIALKDSVQDKHLCFYVALLETKKPSESERSQASKHAARLVRAIAYLQT